MDAAGLEPTRYPLGLSTEQTLYQLSYAPDFITSN